MPKTYIFTKSFSSSTLIFFYLFYYNYKLISEGTITKKKKKNNLGLLIVNMGVKVPVKSTFFIKKHLPVSLFFTQLLFIFKSTTISEIM